MNRKPSKKCVIHKCKDFAEPGDVVCKRHREHIEQAWKGSKFAEVKK